MSGFQELLVIVLIIVAIVFMPRIVPRRGERPAPGGRPRKALSGRMRLGIAFSVFYIGGMAAWLVPWQSDPLAFLWAGVGPVLAGWLICWVAAGFPGR
ncbi:hypothetical protein [Desulfococcus sp.]|uniref:hypothetical protein n=1 Tax=Desulfococcus sp. TaxID=2025834 RepID=UPI0035934EB4